MLRSVSLLALASCALYAHADLLGSTVTMAFANSTSDVLSFGNALVVDPGVEYTRALGQFSFDLTDTTLTITNTSAATTTFGDLDAGISLRVVSGPAITGVSYLSGLAPRSATVTNGRVYFSYGRITFQPSASATFRLTTDVAPTVPGPMAALPFAFMAIKRRRRA